MSEETKKKSVWTWIAEILRLIAAFVAGIGGGMANGAV